MYVNMWLNISCLHDLASRCLKRQGGDNCSKFPRFYFNSLLGEQMVFDVGYGDNNK